MADTGINGAALHGRGTCRALMKKALLTNDCCTIWCWFLLPYCVSQNKKDLCEAAELQLRKGLAQAEQIYFCEVRYNSENWSLFSSSSVGLLSYADSRLFCFCALLLLQSLSSL